VGATGLVLAAVLLLGGRLGARGGAAGGPAPGGAAGGPAPGGAPGGPAAGGALFAGLFGQGATYQAPPGQPAATDLQVDRLREAFNSAAREPRIVLSLSPT
jgi:hypothetical protein